MPKFFFFLGGSDLAFGPGWFCFYVFLDLLVLACVLVFGDVFVDFHCCMCLLENDVCNVRCNSIVANCRSAVFMSWLLWIF